MLRRCLVLQAPCRARPVPPARQAVVEMDVVVAAHQHGGKASQGRKVGQALSSNIESDTSSQGHSEAIGV